MPAVAEDDYGAYASIIPEEAPVGEGEDYGAYASIIPPSSTPFTEKEVALTPTPTPAPAPTSERIFDPSKSREWNKMQSDMEAGALSAGLPPISPGPGEAAPARARLVDAMQRAESLVGREIPRFTGNPNEPTGDRVAGMDVEQLVGALTEAESKEQDPDKRHQISREREYWDNAKKDSMSAEQWREQTGLPDPAYPTPPTLGEKLLQIPKGFTTGVTKGVGNTLQSLGYLSDLAGNIDPDYATASEDVKKQQLEANPIYAAGKFIEKAANDNDVVNEQLQGTAWQEYPEMFGQMAENMLEVVTGAGILRAGKAVQLSKRAAGLLAGAGVFGSQGGAGGLQRAEQAGADQSQMLQSFAANAGIGSATSVIGPYGKWVERLDTATGGGFKKIIKNAITEGGQEALQEVTETLANNYADQQILKSDRELTEGLVKSVEAGGIVGTVASLVFSALGGKGRASSRRKSDDDATPADEPSPDTAPPPLVETPPVDEETSRFRADETSPAETPSTVPTETPAGPILGPSDGPAAPAPIASDVQEQTDTAVGEGLPAQESPVLTPETAVESIAPTATTAAPEAVATVPAPEAAPPAATLDLDVISEERDVPELAGLTIRDGSETVKIGDTTAEIPMDRDASEVWTEQSNRKALFQSLIDCLNKAA